MSSLPSSSSSSSLVPAGTPRGEDGGAPAARDTPTPFEGLLDIRCPVSVILGQGRISVRQCLALAPKSLVPLKQPAGEDLQVFAGRVAIARGEVVIMEDSAAIRLTEMVRPAAPEGR